MSKSNIGKRALHLHMERIVLGPNAWKERTLAGGWLFRWHDSHYQESKRRDLWQQLEDNSILHCPRCGHEWRAKDPARPPVSCPRCKQYFPHREPLPPDWEAVPPSEWW